MKSDLQKTSFGLVNKEWGLVSFETITANQNNGLYKPVEFQGKGTKIIKMGNQYGHPRIYNQDMDRYDLTENELKKFQLCYDDLLFSRRSLVFEGAGECSIVKEKNEPLIFESSIIRVTLNKEIANPDFFFYFFQSHLGRQIIRSINQGTSIAGITGSDLKEILVPLPNIIEQKTITQIFLKIDDMLENIQKQNKIIEQTTQTIFKSLCIDFDGVMEFEDSELGQIPKGWKICELNTIGKIITGKTPPTKEKENFGEDYPFITIPDMQDSFWTIEVKRSLSEKGKNKIQNHLLPENSVCVSCIATPGLVTLTIQDSFTNQQINSIICNDDISPFFVFLTMCVKKDYITQIAAGGTALLNLNKYDFSSIKILLPPINLIDDFHKNISSMFELIKKNKYLISNLIKTRSMLLTKLMSGEIRV